MIAVDTLSQDEKMSDDRILMVDDDAFIREFLTEFLRYHHYQVITAKNGQEALKIFDPDRFDLLISDMDMPEMNGIELIRELKVNRHCEIPILFLTANDKVDTAIEAMRLGATDYIFKEENIQDTLILAVSKALEQQRLKLERKRLAEHNEQLVSELKSINEQLEDRIRQATLDLRRANDELNQSLKELSALYDVGKAVSSVMDLDSLLNLVMEKSEEVMKAEACSLMLLNEDKTHLQFQIAKGGKEHQLKLQSIPVNENSVSGWVATHARPLLIPDAYSDPRFNPETDRRTGFLTKSMLCVPLLNKESVVGVVMVLNHIDGRIFNEKDLSTFAAFANQATVAIENARLYERQKAMAEELREALERERWLSIEKDKMERYIPQDLVDDIHRNREQKLALGGKSVYATVLFSDIQGFTRASEDAEPHQVINHLNQYMTVMANIIEKNNGVLDKFIGDGLMAVFVEREWSDNHALRAVRSAVDMQISAREINTSWVRQGFGQLNVRIGVNTGHMVSGNIGSETRMDYTVIGDNVNLASRLETACEVGKILISQATYDQVQDQVKALRIEPIIVKNRKQPVQPYLIDAFENTDLVC